jgi:hypothetical protein
MCLRLEKNKESFCSDGVFPSTEPMHLISTLFLWAGHTSSEVWESQLTPQISTSEGPKPVKPKSKLNTKTGLAEKCDITVEASSQESSRSEQAEELDQWTSQGEVRFKELINTKPSSKELVWGRSTPVYPGKYSFPLF